jgi:hypothetical protein
MLWKLQMGLPLHVDVAMAAPLMTTLTPELSELGQVIIYVQMYEPSYLDHSARMGICLFSLGKYYNCCYLCVTQTCRDHCRIRKFDR